MTGKTFNLFVKMGVYKCSYSVGCSAIIFIQDFGSLRYIICRGTQKPYK